MIIPIFIVALFALLSLSKSNDYNSYFDKESQNYSLTKVLFISSVFILFIFSHNLKKQYHTYKILPSPGTHKYEVLIDYTFYPFEESDEDYFSKKYYGNIEVNYEYAYSDYTYEMWTTLEKVELPSGDIIDTYYELIYPEEMSVSTEIETDSGAHEMEFTVPVEDILESEKLLSFIMNSKFDILITAAIDLLIIVSSIAAYKKLKIDNNDVKN